MAPHRTEGALKATPERKPRTCNSPNTQQESRDVWLSCCSPSPQAGVDAFSHILDLAWSPVCK